jgi:beta-lactamase regulating signal transducer with metallopeptidase domain
MSDFISMMNDWAEVWGTAMFRVSWMGSLVIIVVWAIGRFFPQMPLFARNWLWRLAYLKLFLLMLWNTPVELPLLSTVRESSVAVAQPIRSQAPRTETGVAALKHAPIVERGIVLPEDTSGLEMPTSLLWLFAMWSCGALACVMLIARNWRRMHEFRAACNPLTDCSLNAYSAALCRQLGKRGGPSLLVTNEAISPQLIGVLRPSIVLPETMLNECDRSAARMALAHELAHWKRRDLAWNWLPAAANVLFYFHPAVWLAQRQWRLAQELACDAAAMDLARSQPDEYGRLLLDIARMCRISVKPSLLSIGVDQSFHALRQRMSALHSHRRSSKFGQLCLAVLLFVSAAVGFVPWKITSREVAAAESATKATDPDKTPSSSAGSQQEPGLPSILPERIYLDVALRGSNDDGKNDEGYSGFIAVDPNTGKFEKLSQDGHAQRVSPDGAHLAYSNDNGVWLWDFKRAGKPRRLTRTAGGGRPVWSGDGREIVVTDQVHNHKNDKSKAAKPIWTDETWRLSTDGAKKTWLPVPSSDGVDDWSSDGKWFVTCSDRHEPFGSGYQLYLISPDGTQQRRLTHGRGLNVYARFSPDGKKIVFLHQERGENSIRMIDVTDGKESVVLKDDGLDRVDMACWSPDGKQLAVTRVNWQMGPDGKKHLEAAKADYRLEIVSLDGKSRRPLKLEGPKVWFMGHPDWK